MKKIVFTAWLLAILSGSFAQRKSTMTNSKPEEVIRIFTKALDNRDIETVSGLLHPQFRVILANFQQSGKTITLTKEQYLTMLHEGKVGGQKRTLTVLISDTKGRNALLKVELEGEKQIFTNYYSLLEENGVWLVVQDLPHITNK